MSYSGLSEFITELDKKNELIRIKNFVNPVLEITEITDRITKAGGKALLFENTGTQFPLLINAFGSDERMAMALGRKNLGDAAAEIESLFINLTGNKGNILKKLAQIPALFNLAALLPGRLIRKGLCQQVIHTTPDLGILPILKCWPYDGGPFITLPMVHTTHPDTGNSNVGMYRMQVLDKNTTAMHWQRHKTGANHFEAWKRRGGRMPVSVALGGDPVYTYSSTAPLPENVDEYILAGFLRKKKVKMVRCITNDLYVPSDADIILEGYVDTMEDPVWEGPFGDHTGFYSLADWYPKFHLTCITHSKKAVYPATIVGIPPQEDAWLAKATERLFLAPVRLTIQPEIEDFHMPEAGIAHNLVIVKIKKTFPGQGMKVVSSLFGAGQMMFTKYLVVVSGDINIRDYAELAQNVLANVSLKNDLLFNHGPLDVLDHSSDAFSFGGKLGVDATLKTNEELQGRLTTESPIGKVTICETDGLFNSHLIEAFDCSLLKIHIPIIIIAVNRSDDADIIEKVKSHLKSKGHEGLSGFILAVDHSVDPGDFHMVAWQLLGNSDPQRDHEYILPYCIFIDGTIKAYRKGGFSRRWPNVVCSDNKTITAIDQKWESLGLGPLLPSPSVKNMLLCREGTDAIVIDGV